MTIGKRLGISGLFVLLAACGGPREARAPRGLSNLATSFGEAFHEEAVGSSASAVGRYVQVLDDAAGSSDPASVAVTMASLHALVHRDVGAFAEFASSSALADRTSPASLEKTGGSVDARLAKVQEHAAGPFSRPLVANARLSLAERRGDANAASELRKASGCVREAVLMGPVSWSAVDGVHEPSTLDTFDAPLPRTYAGTGPFETKRAPQPVKALGCRLPLTAATSARGVREIVVDVDVPRAGDLGFALRATGEATLRVGGKIAVENHASAGDGEMVRMGRVHVDRSGVLRLVARTSMSQDFATVEIDAWDDDGKPLVVHAPRPDARATVAASRVEPLALPVPKTDPERLVVAAAALASGENHTAENLLHARVATPNAPADLLLVYGRAVRVAQDLPRVTSIERARGAFGRVLDTWPSSWEAKIERAVLAGERRSQDEARIEILSDLDKPAATSTTASKTTASKEPEGHDRDGRALISAFEAAVAGSAHVADRARAAFARTDELQGTPLRRAVERAMDDRTGREAVAFDCDAHAPADRTSLQCYRSLVSTGDRAGAERELERLRALAEAPQLHLTMTARSALETGDLAGVSKAFASMNPGNRLLSTLYALRGKTSDLRALAPIARDAPQALPPLLHASGENPLAAWEGIAERVAGQAAPRAADANAATIILTHEEKYDVEESGLVHYTMIDVRRVMGTADVEENAQARLPSLFGRDTTRVLRRRIFKKDGRVLLPDQTPNAAQSHADLSQLETGDAVEAIYEGWSLPSEDGNVGFDTPDLLPERTTVQSARIEVKLPKSLRGSLWSHPVLGKPQETNDGGKRVLVWSLRDKPVRRIEYGVPKMDRLACISYSTTTWKDVAQGLRETLSELDGDEPEVTAWAREASAGKNTPQAVVEAVVEASGKAIKEASGAALSDVDLGSGSARSLTARTALTTHEGSRTWLVTKALRSLGIPTDIVIAENDPYSSSPDFPPHFGRFMHPLAIAHVGRAAGANPASQDLWIDADVPGPPLPAGKISPELRGRLALWTDGEIRELPQTGNDDARDEVDERLVVDDKGNAKGSLTVLLRGRSAQDLSEALVRLVGDERQRALRDIALAWLPFATIEKVELSSSEGSWQVAIRAELEAPAYAQVQGQKPGQQTWILPGIDPLHFVFPRAFVTTLAASYANRASRENALAIGRASQYHVRRRIDLPKGASIARLPGPFESKGPLLTAARKISVEGLTLEEDFTLDLRTGTIPQDAYDAFVLRARSTDDAFRASTQVKPPRP